MTYSAESGSSPYATGGGGVVFEHAYAGSVLAALLLGQPVAGLGDDVTPIEVALQQASQSPVDDLEVVGVSAGVKRTLRLACRRRPTLGKSSESTVKLFLDFVRIVVDEPEPLQAGSVRLGLVVAGPYGPATELAELTEIARSQPSNEAFRAAVAAPGEHTDAVRRRLTNIDDLVEAALARPDAPDAGTTHPKELCWRLLSGLFVIQEQLEGDTAPSRTRLVGQLQALAGDVTRADNLRRRLNELASTYAVRAGRVTRAMLRHDLRSFGRLDAASDFRAAHDTFALLEAELRRSVHVALPVAGTTSFTLDRSQHRDELQQVITAGRPGSVVLVRGEPDVGKSALALSAVDAIREAGGTTIVLSLRDLPESVLAFQNQLGGSPTGALSAAASAPDNVLLVDGAEAVQEYDRTVLDPLLDAAIAVGMTAVIVVRDDAAGTVRDLLPDAYGPPFEFVVPALTDAEVAELADAVPSLWTLAVDDRSRWLLKRLGLVELLLRVAARGSRLPTTLPSEADVFGNVWFGLIRNSERTVDGVAPDDREAAAHAVARELLTGKAIGAPGPALAALRSDGILASREMTAVWAPRDRFASDVLRDFAVASLLLRDGLQTLTTSSAPRWAIRATRLYCQARLARAAGGEPAGFLSVWNDLQSEVASLAEEHGVRWSELPWEALLTARWADRALAALSPRLLADRPMRNEALRCLKLRFSHAGSCDPLIGGPIVGWFLANHAAVANEHRTYSRDDPIDELILSWLRGVAAIEATGADIADHTELRTLVRDHILARDPERHNEQLLEALALLGADTTDASRDALRTVAAEAPSFLAPVVESTDVALSLARHDPAFLAELAEAYYVIRPGERRYASIMDQGVRSHRGTGGMRGVAWYYGPFYLLLRADFRRGLTLINRMLDRAAHTRVADVAGPPTEHGRGDLEPAEIPLLGTTRSYVGDEHVWAWYRGSTVGPYPCMSALLALERLIDELVAHRVLSPRRVAGILLEDASTLATIGLVVGFLVRHIDSLTDELDDFLADPGIWMLEFGRASSEGHLHVQGPDPADLTGQERRGWTMRHVANHLVMSAISRGDDQAIERLRSVGQRLIDAAGAEKAPPQVRQWAANLDSRSYGARAQDGHIVVEVEVPADVAEALAPVQAHTNRIGEMYRLQNRYRPHRVTPYRQAIAPAPAGDELQDDIRIARALSDDLPTEPLDAVRTAQAGVAATTLHARTGGAALNSDDLAWAQRLLANAATEPYMDQYSIPESMHADGADRHAALALPLALHPELAAIDTVPDATAIGDALQASTTSLFNEVRHNAAEGLRALWSQPCRTVPDGRCVHRVGWHAVESGARAVAYGPLDENFRRGPETLHGDLPAELAARPDQDLALPSIAPAAISTLEAAGVDCCISEHAHRLRPALLDAYARAAKHWSSARYDYRDEQHAAFAAALLRWSSPVDLASSIADVPGALGDLLKALALAATYDPSLVTQLGNAWPRLMDLGLAAVTMPNADRQGVENLIRNLIPDPTVVGWESNIDAVLTAARSCWLGIPHIREHVDRWIDHARGVHFCADSLVGFLKAQPRAEQVEFGLPWVRGLIVRPDGTARTCGFLTVSWLEELRNGGFADPAAWSNYRAIVDALVLGNYSGARALQQRDE